MVFKKALWISAALLLLAGNAVADDDVCKTQEDALDACVQTNNCQACEDEGGEPPEEPAELTAFGGTEINALVEAANTFLASTCDWSKDNICVLQECCPNCANEISAAMECIGADLGSTIQAGMDQLTAALEGSAGVLGNLTDALPEGALDQLPGGGTSQSTPELEFTCSFTDIKCEGGKAVEGGSSGSESGSSGTSSEGSSGTSSEGSSGSSATTLGLMTVSFMAGMTMMML